MWRRDVHCVRVGTVSSRTRRRAGSTRVDARSPRSDSATFPTTAGPASTAWRRTALVELRTRRAVGATRVDSQYRSPFSPTLRDPVATALVAEVDLHLQCGLAYPACDRLFGAPIALADLGGRFSGDEPGNQNVAQSWLEPAQRIVEIHLEKDLIVRQKRVRIGHHVDQRQRFAFIGGNRRVQ